MFLTKYLELALTAVEAAVVDDDGLLGEAGYSFLLQSLSSSLMVSNTFAVRRLMTLITCGGATSVTNLAIREFAISVWSFRYWRMVGNVDALGAQIGLVESECKILGDIYEE